MPHSSADSPLVNSLGNGGPYPLIWLLMGKKAGDNAQVLALAEALGWPYKVKRMVYRGHELLTNIALGATLAGIVKRKSSPLQPPWPDLVVSAGRRNESVARWIRKQAEAPVRLVHFGRPWASPDCFDLIITTPQYSVPKSANVLHNILPLHHITAAKLAESRQRWLPRLARLPRPYFAVLVGGHASEHFLTPARATLLARQAVEMARRENGSLLVTTSRRTPKAVSAAIAAAVDVPNYFHYWKSADHDNPYTAYLALADAFIVTGDSVSMLAEACEMRKPVFIFANPVAENHVRRLSDMCDLGPRVILSRVANRLGPQRLVRDIGVIHRQLIKCKRAAWLGRAFPTDAEISPLEDLDRAIARVRSLMGWDETPYDGC